MQLFTLHLHYNIRRKSINNAAYISHCFHLKYSALQISNEKVQHISVPTIWRVSFSLSHPPHFPKREEPSEPWEPRNICCCCLPRFAAPCVALLCERLVSLPFATTYKNVHWDGKPLMKRGRLLRKTWRKFNLRNMEKNIRITCGVL